VPVTGQVVVAACISALLVPAVDHVDILTLGKQATV